MATPISKVIRILLTGALEGKDKIFRGHVFVEGEKVMCGGATSIAAVLNSMRGRLPHAVEELDPQEGLRAYGDYCTKARVPVDASAVHNLGKVKGVVDLKVMTEDEDNTDLDAELDTLLAQGDGTDSEGEDDDDDSDGVEDPDEDDNGNIIPAPEGVEPAVGRENVLRTALGQLDHSNPDHWTAQGLPKMSVLEEFLEGHDLPSRKEVTAIDPDFKRNH